MTEFSPTDQKRLALRGHSLLHPHPEAVRDPVFDDVPFFDRHDLVQVRYEMLRRVRIEGLSVVAVCSAFGCSRPVYYRCLAAFEKDGLPGLVPRRRGPRGPHKLTDEVMKTIEAENAAALDIEALTRWVHERFGLSVHPRSIQRALERREKKRH